MGKTKEKIKAFENVKNDFINTIDKINDVNTKDKTSGIYILYIDNIDLDNLIPIYVGQSKNIYARKNNHKSKIKRLFNLPDEVYNDSIMLNSGEYLYCKLVSTLKNNGKDMEDIKFKVLEYCNQEELDEREQYWIKYFESTIYGFNQFDEIIKSNQLVAELTYKSDLSGDDYDRLLLNGKKVLEMFKNKTTNFDKDLLKYKYYSINYHLLFGNYMSLITILENVSAKHLMDISEFIDDEIDEAKMDLSIKAKIFISKGYIEPKDKVFDAFKIKIS